MKILYINRNPKIGFSIHKVFLPIINCMKNYADVKMLDMEGMSGSFSDVRRNCRLVKKSIGSDNEIVYHITGDVHYCTIPLKGKKVVVTVHDLGRYFNLKGIHKRIFWLLRIFPLKFAKKVVCISQATVDEVKQAISIPENKICIIPDEVGDEFQYTEKEFNQDCPIILHIGTRPHKNLTRTIAALKEIRCKMRIIGKVEDKDVELLKKNRIEHTILQNLSDDELLQEYKDADIINFPSYHEGFGMPIIEGQAIGRLVITSDMEPMKSVAGEGAILCNPFNVKSIRNAYLKGIKDNDYRESVIKAGLENVEKYRLENITKQYLELYKSL